MSSDSLALLRRNAGTQYAKLAEQHYKHDLTDNDRSSLESAVRSLSLATTLGSVAGLGLGLFFAFRIRATRKRMFEAFRASEKPTQVMFAGGRTEPIPDITPLLKPSALGDFATYALFASGGLFLGGELGLLTGGFTARRAVTRDVESRKRIENAFRNFRAEVLRAEADKLTAQTAGEPGLLDRGGMDGFI